MARVYRKKPVVIEAVQWTGENHAEMCEFINPEVFEIIPRVGLVIRTLEGDHHASPGDYIIKGVNGEFYPCKPDIFAKTYESASLTPPNEPLTLDELREMDGEPVWIVEHPDWGHWELSADAEDYLADRDQDFYALKHDDPEGRYGLHVLGWLAYRRPPEGET